MDSRARYRFVLWVIVVLVVMNLGSLGFIWYGHLLRPQTPPRDGDKVDPEEFLVGEVGLDGAQAATVHSLREQHFRQTDSLKLEIQRLNRQLTEELFVPSPDSATVRQLVETIAAKHAEFERDVFEHYGKIKELCRPDQQVRLRRLMLEALDNPPNRPPKSSARDRQSPPPDDRPAPPRDDDHRRPPEGGNPRR